MKFSGHLESLACTGTSVAMSQAVTAARYGIRDTAALNNLGGLHRSKRGRLLGMDDEVLQDDEESRIELVDGTVRRPRRWWNESVHHLLSHLEAVGFKGSPRPLGYDDQGREILSFIDGESGRQAGQRVSTLPALANFAAFVRSFHDAVRDYRPPSQSDWALPDAPRAPSTGICHGDFAPWNIVWSGNSPVGIIDFDLAHPAPLRDDVAYALAYSVPFRNDTDTRRILGVDEVPNRPERVAVFADAYGIAVDGLVDAVVRRQAKYARDVEHLRDRGLMTRWTSPSSIAANHEIASWAGRHRSLFEPA